MDFKTTAINVLLLVAMAIPGFLLVKSKLVKAGALAPFSALLLYVCQPFLSLRSFLEVEYTKQLAVNIGIVFGVAVAAQLLVFGIMWLILNKKFDKPEDSAMLLSAGYIGGHACTKEPELNALITSTVRGRANRVMVLTATFGNVGFFGIPVLQFLFPEAPQAIAYAAVYVVSMNLISWTLGAYVLTGDVRHIRVKRALLNPQTVTLIISLPLFFCGVTMGDLPSTFGKIIGYLADMTAPLCMIILGMRFALAPLTDMFKDWKVYVSTAIKIIAFPLVVFLVLMPFSMEPVMRATLVVLSGMPAAAINLNLAELFGADQKSAANTILLSTLLSILTIPLMMLLVA